MEITQLVLNIPIKYPTEIHGNVEIIFCSEDRWKNCIYGSLLLLLLLLYCWYCCYYI